jgi:hypothetical protein
VLFQHEIDLECNFSEDGSRRTEPSPRIHPKLNPMRGNNGTHGPYLGVARIRHTSLILDIQ